MSTHTRALSAITGIGVAVFVLVVLLLHLSQASYDPLSQFMSELALGRFGDLLLVAFLPGYVWCYRVGW